MMACAVPVARIMRRFGRRAGFTLGHGLGVAAGLVGCKAVLDADFALYALASMLAGAYFAHAFHHRFAAAETVADGQRERAIGLVMAGGVVAALAGPQLASVSRDLFAPVAFAGSWLAIAGLGALGLVLVQVVELPAMAAPARAAGAAPTRLAKRPAFLVAVLCAVVAYASMNLVMTATPLAVLDCQLPFSAAAMVIQWHVFAMYAPAFVTGDLIRRIGVRPTMAAGLALIAACVAVNLSGVQLPHFISALILLGVGWNLLFVGATTLLVRAYDAEQAARAQGLNDTLVFAAMASSALGSGWLYATLGWQAVNLVILAPLAFAAVALALLPGTLVRPAESRP
jgi:predicted MFS family arabinose efflux permease